MSSLRDYVTEKAGYVLPGALTPGEFVVANTSESHPNGGCCYLWTVPAGVTRAVFEMWSAGGNGGGGCCCMQGGGAGSGGYAIKVCTVAAGQQIRICAAGSGCCMQTEGGSQGCPTFICNLTTGWCACVTGGYPPSRTVTCNLGGQCYSCCTMCYCCGGIGSNVNLYYPGTTGNGHSSQYCFEQFHQYAGTAYGVPGPRLGPNGCQGGYGGGPGCGIFPGGGGWSVQLGSTGGCCCGGPGAGGLVYVLYI